MFHKSITRTLVLGAWVVSFAIVRAQNTTSNDTFAIAEVSTGLDDAWMLIMGALVFFMQAGFAVLEAGAVSKSDTRNILFKNLLDVCCTGLGWWGFGFAFAFGNGDHPGKGFIGNRFFFASYMPDDINNVGFAYWFFEFCFAAASATIVSGAVAERATFQVYIIWSLINTVWVYPLVAHWEWSPQGWLSATNTDNPLLGIGMIDFAGCGAVHTVGGAGALIGAIVSGIRNKNSKVAKFKPRFERVNNKWIVNDIPGKSDIFSSLGVLILWFAWYGFNCGSTLRMSTTGTSNTASRISVTTTLSTCAAGLTAVLVGRYLSSSGNFNINDANNGILAGLVSITAGCAVVEPWAAVIIGALGAIFFKIGSFALLKLRIDDPVDAAPLHFGCGVWGLLSCGIFAAQGHMQEVYGHSEYFGLFMGGGGKQLAAQIIGALVISAWTLFWALLFWVPAKQLDKRRQDRVLFIKEDVTGGVDQRFIHATFTKDFHSNLAELGNIEIAHDSSLTDMRAGLHRADSTMGEREDMIKYLTFMPSKRKAFLEFLANLPDEPPNPNGK